VTGAFQFLDGVDLPADLSLGVVGESSFNALLEKLPDSTPRIIRSFPYSSEGLLESPELQRVRHKNIIIFRGQQGRNLLGDTLVKRGATVTYCDVYQRQLPQYGPNHFIQLCANRSITLVMFTSNEGMLNTLRLIDLEAQRVLLQTPWLLISERMRESAVKLGHNAEIVIAANASDVGIHQTIIEWARRA
jgi:uroporphyrinogen-III synthase